MKMILLLLVKPFELQEHWGKAATADNKVMKMHVETKNNSKEDVALSYKRTRFQISEFDSGV